MFSLWVFECSYPKLLHRLDLIVYAEPLRKAVAFTFHTLQMSDKQWSLSILCFCHKESHVQSLYLVEAVIKYFTKGLGLIM